MIAFQGASCIICNNKFVIMSKQSSEYFEGLMHDYAAFGLAEDAIDSGFTNPPESHDELVATLEVAPCSILASDPRRTQALTEVNPTDLATDLGGKIFMLYGTDIEFDGWFHNDFSVCSEAEWRLAKNTQLQGSTKTPKMRPVILCDGDTPVGIIKTNGEESCYGLVDRYDLGIVKGAFSSPSSLVTWVEVPRSRTPWRIDVKDIEPLCPTRFSTYAIPQESRKDLTNSSKVALIAGLSHEELEARAAHLLNISELLDIANMNDPTDPWTLPNYSVYA